MFLVKYLIVIISLVSALRAIADFEFNITTRQEYCNSIARLRKDISKKADNIPYGIRILPQTPSEQLTRIQLKNDRDDVVHLVMQNKNLYIVGFIAGGFFYRLNDHSDVNIIGVDTVDLQLKSNYVDLTRAASRSLEDVEISLVKLDGFISDLFRYGNEGGTNVQTLARAFLGLAIGIPESLRFGYISSRICEDMFNETISYTFRLGRIGVNFVRRWSTYSEYAAFFEHNPGEAERHITEYYQGKQTRLLLHNILAVALFCILHDGHPHSISENSELECLVNTKTVHLIIYNDFWLKENFIEIFF